MIPDTDDSVGLISGFPSGDTEITLKGGSVTLTASDLQQNMELDGNVITGELTPVESGACYLRTTLADEFSDLQFIEGEGEPTEGNIALMLIRYKTASDEITAFNGIAAKVDGLLLNALMFDGSMIGYAPEDVSAIESIELVYYSLTIEDANALMMSVMRGGSSVVDVTGFEQIGCAYDITAFKDTFFPPASSESVEEPGT